MPENKDIKSTKVKLILPPPDNVLIPDLDVNLIQPNPNNPMTMGERVSDLLVKNIKIGGFITVITVWKPEGSEKYQLIDGEHRWRAMIALGHKTLPALYARHIKTQTQADYFLLMLNRIKGHFEQNKLGLMISDLDKSFEHISELTGYAPDLIDAMTRLINVEKVPIDSIDIKKTLEGMTPEAGAVADPSALVPTHPLYDKKPTSLFMVNLPTEDFLKLSEMIEKIKAKENIPELAKILVKVFEDYANKLG